MMMSTAFRSKPCAYQFNGKGKCRNGHHCSFAHNSHQLELSKTAHTSEKSLQDRSQMPLYKTRMCKWGDSCTKAEMCGFAHKREELRHIPVSVDTTFAPIAVPPQYGDMTAFPPLVIHAEDIPEYNEMDFLMDELEAARIENEQLRLTIAAIEKAKIVEDAE